MCLRWTAAGMLEAERQFRRIIGYHDLAALVVAIDNEHDHSSEKSPSTASVADVKIHDRFCPSIWRWNGSVGSSA
jgi:hypothetical protein